MPMQEAGNSCVDEAAARWTDITPKQLVKRVLSRLETTRGDGKLIRVISARAMHRKERLHYEQEA
jgi:uncharacterized DUF497 family protein